MKFRWLWVSTLFLSCTTGGQEPRAVPAQATEALEDTARERLRARLDDARFQLGPTANVAEAAEFDASTALQGLRAVTEQELESEVAGSTWRASGASYSASFELVSGRFMLSGRREYQAGLAHAADDVLYERARTLLSGLASDVADHALDLKHLGATTRLLGDEVEQVDERIGSKVFVIRRLGGLRVAGNRLVASFATDGTVIEARGIWPRVDVANSQLSSTLALEDAKERALDVLVAHGVNPNRAEPIVLESFYQLEPGPEGMVARLRGAALVTSYNHEEQPGRRERHEFEL